MKTLLMIFGLMMTVSVFSQTVYVNPTVFNFGNLVQVQIRNNTQDNISCSGTVIMQTQLGRTETGYYYDNIPRNSFSMKSFYLMSIGDRISFVNQFIRCSKAFGR